MSEIKVNSIKGVGASAAAITVNNSDGTATANLTNRQGKNLVVNGACLIAQRGTSSTASGYGSVDRFTMFHTGTDEAPTQEQADVTSGTTPYTLGFRKSLKITNGNQTSGAGAADYIIIRTILEAQDIANSGWNYLSASSNITLSFWVKSSVAQNFYGNLWTQDGTSYNYVFETGSLSADTWTKVTKTVSGNSNLTFNNDNGPGLRVQLVPFEGTNYTGTRPLNAWAAFDGNTIQPNNTSTWYTTNDATLEITGVQIEVGSVATDFEHRSFAQELALCKRYYQQIPQNPADAYAPIGVGRVRSGTNAQVILTFPEMRTSPSVAKSGNLRILHAATAATVNSVSGSHLARTTVFIEPLVSSGLTQGQGCLLTADNDSNGKITLTAEL